MKENRNDRQYGQTSTTQSRNRNDESKEGSMGGERSSSGSQMGIYDQEEPENLRGQQQNLRSQLTDRNQRSGEYSSSDELDDDLDDDETISMFDDEEDEDFLDDEDNSQMNQRGRQDSDFGSGSQNF